MSKMPPDPYSPEVRGYMVRMYHTLTEKGKRHYAGIEAIKLGHGGIGYICELFALHRDTVSQGIKELKEDSLPPNDRTRRAGGGRKKKAVDEDEQTLLKFSETVDTYRAGCPMNEHVRYTYLRPGELAQRMKADHDLSLSNYLILRLLAALGMKSRRLSKTGTARQVEGRNEQFEYISKLIKEYRAAGYAIYSVDGKKKEFLGTLYRSGKSFCDQPLVCQDHDFPSLATGRVCPYGVYDLTLNRGHMFLNQSVETADYAADCIDHVLGQHHHRDYPGTTKVLLLADSGGSNGARIYRYKQLLEWIAKKHGLEIRVAHYPSYCSKYNPCDHRLFPHVTRAMSGVLLDSVTTMRDLIKERARTKTGLRVWVRQVKKTYHTGVKAAKEFIENNSVVFDELRPKWNYVFNSQLSAI